MTDEQDNPIFTLAMLSDWFWGFARALGVIGLLMAILWIAGKVH